MGGSAGAPARAPAARPDRRVRTTWSFVTGVLVIAVIGLIGHVVPAVLLAAALAPTAYVLLVDPTTNRTHVRTVLAAHAVAVVAGTAVSGALGLWGHQLTVTGQPSARQAVPAALSVGLTGAALDWFGLHHAPAVSTALLLGATLVPAGRAELELIGGLAVVIVLSWLLRLAGRRFLPEVPLPEVPLPGGH